MGFMSCGEAHPFFLRRLACRFPSKGPLSVIFFSQLLIVADHCVSAAECVYDVHRVPVGTVHMKNRAPFISRKKRDYPMSQNTPPDARLDGPNFGEFVNKMYAKQNPSSNRMLRESQFSTIPCCFVPAEYAFYARHLNQRRLKRLYLSGLLRPEGRRPGAGRWIYSGAVPLRNSRYTYTRQTYATET
ncbi:hypothetical protein B0H12DRAFT_659216 [Mycena haematopus]|nr:hypothetical protein B0H12DRAFT_659216 [Mycena haematopus]